MPPPPDPWLQGLFYLLATASVVTWLGLLVRRVERPFLSYEPRQPVPWHWPGALLALVYVALPITLTLTAGDTEPQPELEGASRSVAMYLVQQLLVAGFFLWIIARISGATLPDLGVPQRASQWRHDAVTGVIACVAALLPVQGTQVLLAYWLGQPSQHPLVELVMDEPSLPLMALAFIAAVVVAPFCEEIVFRLLLQGWLEKLEDDLLGWRAATASVDKPEQTGDRRPLSIHDHVQPEDDMWRAAPEAPAPIETKPPPTPPRRGLLGLPYGWVPIIISSQIFALAHYGHGTDPIPLFLLGLVLGYTYQRTHRITACIVTHVAFNLLSMVVLWRVIQLQAS